MHTRAATTLYDYWTRQRGERAVPLRSTIEPADIAAILPDVFMLEYGRLHAPRFRLAGTRMCAQFARELKGMDFDALFAPDQRSRVARMAENVMTEAVPAIMRIRLVDGALEHLADVQDRVEKSRVRSRLPILVLEGALSVFPLKAPHSDCATLGEAGQIDGRAGDEALPVALVDDEEADFALLQDVGPAIEVGVRPDQEATTAAFDLTELPDVGALLVVGAEPFLARRPRSTPRSSPRTRQPRGRRRHASQPMRGCRR